MRKIKPFINVTQTFKGVDEDVEVYTASQSDVYAPIPSPVERQDEQEPKVPPPIVLPITNTLRLIRNEPIIALEEALTQPREPELPLEKVPEMRPIPNAVLPSTEELDVEDRVYSSDREDEKFFKCEAQIAPQGFKAPLKLGSIPVASEQQAAVQSEKPAASRPSVRFSELPNIEIKREAPMRSPRMASKTTIKARNKRSPPKGLLNPPPLKLIKVEECLMKPKLESNVIPRLGIAPALRTNPVNTMSVLMPENTAVLPPEPILPSGNVAPIMGLPGLPIPPDAIVKSCLDDAKTAAELMGNNHDGTMEQPNQYSLRPLPPPLLPAPSLPPALDVVPGEASGNASQLPSLGIIASRSSDGGLTQMGDSEPQGLPPAEGVPPDEPVQGVRRAQELLLGRGSRYGGFNERITPINGPGKSRFAPQQTFGGSPSMRALVIPSGTVAATPVAVRPQALLHAAAPCSTSRPQNQETLPVSRPPLAAASALPLEKCPEPRNGPAASDVVFNSPGAGGMNGSAPGTTRKSINTNAATISCPPASAAPGGNLRAATNPNSATRPPTQARPTSAQNGSGAGSESINPSVKLSAYLGGALLEAMRTHGQIPDEIFKWQAECLLTDDRAVLDDSRNLVFTAPTSSGKTLVAEILMLRALATKPGRKVMLVLPYVQLCIEKATRLAPMVQALNLQVVHAYGGHYSGAVQSPAAGIIVCTIENANNIINRRLESGTSLHDEYSCIVVDELHNLSDPNRGYQLELLLTKLRYQEKYFEAKRAEAMKAKAAEEAAAAAAPTGPSAAADSPFKTPARQLPEGNIPASSSKRDSSVRRTNVTTPHHTATTVTTTDVSKEINRVQIIGMSATLPNIDRIGAWLNAAIYQSTHRPVPLVQYLKVGTTLFTLPTPTGDIINEQGPAAGHDGGADPSAPLSLVPAAELPPAEKWDTDHVGYFTKETVDQGSSVLVFCATKKGCVLEATQLSKHLEIPDPNKHPEHMQGINTRNSEEENDEDEEDKVIDQNFVYTRENVASYLEGRGLEQSKVLAGLIRKGIAYHNSDLDPEEKNMIVGAYCSGAIKVICATSTLAAGVNLPARRVIFKHAYVSLPRPEYYLTASRYHQMAGRAGRTGMDERGESILIYSSNLKVPRAHLEYLIRSKPENVESCLTTSSKLLTENLLTHLMPFLGNK